MSKEQRIPLKGEQEDLNIDSVFDFIYYDSRRIASFLSQFYSAGYLKQIVKDEGTNRSENKAGNTKIGGGVSSLISGEKGHSNETGSSVQRSHQRVYDPFWANARAFLDRLDELNMIQTNIELANMGQFVLCSGNLSITDLKLAERTWRLKSVQALMKQGQVVENRKQRRSKSGNQSSNPNQIDMVIELLSIMPHTIQAKISGTTDVWCSLGEEGMSTLASDITLKHGTNIPGLWYALGILDAKPEELDDDDDEVDFSDGQEIAAKLMVSLGPLAKNLLGRPDDCFGITPLLIFREVIPKHVVMA